MQEGLNFCIDDFALHRGMEQWQLVGLITRRSVVRIHLPLPDDIHVRHDVLGVVLFV